MGQIKSIRFWIIWNIEPSQPGRNNRNFFWRLISRKVKKMGMWNFDKNFIEVLNLCYQNFGLISVIMWKLYTFQQRSTLGHFQQFIHFNFRLKLKFWILMVSSERSISDSSEYAPFQIKKKFFYKNQILGEKWKNWGYFFFQINSKV